MGRHWPLLTGERAHYELAAGRIEEARRLLAALQHFASPEGLLPEQTWDGEDLPERELFFGQPAGSAMPLVWAHAEYLKLCRSLGDGRISDMPPQTVERYSLEQKPTRYVVWAFNHKIRNIAPDKTLRFFLPAPARVRWSHDEWSTEKECETHDSTLGVHVAELPTGSFKQGATLRFTFYWLAEERWEGGDYTIEVT